MLLHINKNTKQTKQHFTYKAIYNGVINSLQEVIELYNSPDDLTTPVTPEVAQNVDNVGKIGELGLTADEITSLIAFLETLSD